MNRYRFHANGEDWRPVVWPPVGPCWLTGSGIGFSTVVAYANSEEDILRQWPEATEIDCMQEDVEPVFTDRFQKPSWWPGRGIWTLRVDRPPNAPTTLYVHWRKAKRMLRGAEEVRRCE